MYFINTVTTTIGHLYAYIISYLSIQSIEDSYFNQAQIFNSSGNELIQFFFRNCWRIVCLSPNSESLLYS